MKRTSPAEKTEKPIKKSRRLRWLIYVLFWVAMIGAFGFLAAQQSSQYADIQADIARIRAETEQAMLEHERLQRQMQFIGSDAYIEEQARRRLGLVLPTEIIFINIGR